MSCLSFFFTGSNNQCSMGGGVQGVDSVIFLDAVGVLGLSLGNPDPAAMSTLRW